MMRPYFKRTNQIAKKGAYVLRTQEEKSRTVQKPI